MQQPASVSHLLRATRRFGPTDSQKVGREACCDQGLSRSQPFTGGAFGGKRGVEEVLADAVHLHPQNQPSPF